MGDFERTPKSYHDPVLWAWFEVYPSPKRYRTNSKTPHYLLPCCFPFNALLMLDILRGALLTLKRYDKYPCHFLNGHTLAKGPF